MDPYWRRVSDYPDMRQMPQGPQTLLGFIGLSLTFIGAVAVYSIAQSYHLIDRLIALIEDANKQIPYVSVWAGLGALALGLGLYIAREWRNHRAYAPCEIAFGSIVAGYSFHKIEWAGVLGFAAGVRIIIDGIKRRKDLREKRELKVTKP